jgi:3-hydroxypropanoate dehydrogenase
MSHQPLSDAALDQLLRTARTAHKWLDRPVTDEQIHQLYELVKFGPTTANSQPGRFVFVRSAEAKEKLRPALSSTIVDKTMAAPVVAIAAYDLKFYENLPKTFPRAPTAKDWYVAIAEQTALRNGSLSGGYMILAARAMGLDCGPMSGFKNDVVDAAFFPDGRWKSNFLCNIGYGDFSAANPRDPRLTFDEACKIV